MTLPNGLKQVKFTQSKDGRVAIIMRTKDRPILLPRAFASVLAQTHENWHLYLVNDGGLQRDLEKIVAANENDFRGRLTLIHHETSRGMEAASNSALKRAKGEFLIVHDDDDAWSPEFLEKTVGFLNDPINIIFAAVVTSVDMIHEQIVGDRIIELERMEFRNWGSGVDFSKVLFRNLYPPISFLMRMSIVKAVGEFNHQLPVLGDWDFNIRVLMFGDVGTITERLAQYHLRKTSDDSIYENSVSTGNDLHEKYDILYRNGTLRGSLKTNPEMMGVVQALGRQIDESRKEIVSNLNNQFGPLHDQVLNLNRQIDLVHARLTHLEEAVVNRDLIHRILTPARWVRSITRRIIAKLSKKS